MLAVREKRQVVVVFAGREGGADPVFSNEGAAPPPPQPRHIFMPSMLAVNKTHRIITMFAVREGCAVIWFANRGAPPSQSPTQ